VSAINAADSAKALRDAVSLSLRTQPNPLFGIIDAARSQRALHLLSSSTDQHDSLYNGESAKKLALVAPYLVKFSRYSELLQALVQEGWGESWGIYLTCDRDFVEVRRHFRQFLTVEVEGQGNKRLLFRFYDPRVLRAYLPTCTAEELKAFLAPNFDLFLEGEDARLVRYRAGAGGLEVRDSMSPAGSSSKP